MENERVMYLVTVVFSDKRRQFTPVARRWSAELPKLMPPPNFQGIYDLTGLKPAGSRSAEASARRLTSRNDIDVMK